MLVSVVCWRLKKSKHPLIFIRTEVISLSSNNICMNFIIEPGSLADIDELERLYDELNDHLSATINYPGWIKGIYPVRENAAAGVDDNSLFVARCDGGLRVLSFRSSAGKGL